MSAEKYPSHGQEKNVVKENIETYDPFERYEIIHGVRYDFLPSPGFHHQLLVTEINRSLYQTCHPSGIVVVAPMDVHLDANNTVQPDIVFIRNENLHIVKNQRIEGVPDLLVEILSKGTGKHDRSRKMSLYESFAVPEYWIVDPPHFTVEQYVLVDRRYTLRAIYGEGDRMDSETFPCVSIEMDSLFAPVKRFMTD